MLDSGGFLMARFAVGTLAPRQRATSLRETSAELGMSAIDYMQSERSLLLSPIYGKEKPSRSTFFVAFVYM